MTDVLTEVIGALRIRTTLFAMADLKAPWGVRFPASDGAYFHAVTGAECWLSPGGADPVRVRSGDVVLLAHGTAHQVSGSRRGVARVEFDPATWRPNTLVEAVPPPPDGERERNATTTLVCGAIDVPALEGQPLLGLLPALVVFSALDVAATDLRLTLELLGGETGQARPGSQTVLARLGDVLLVQLLRIWVGQDDSVGHCWLHALRDPQINAALQAIHASPGEPWTVESLAAQARLSRSRFAERFAAATGETPLGYLTRWRLTVAAGLLRDGRAVGQVARAVGYTSEPAFSRAFRRQYAQPPSRIRGNRLSASASSRPARPSVGHWNAGRSVDGCCW